MNTFQLAQVNIARMKAAIDDSVMVGFVDLLESVNALADSSPGFIWRLQSEESDATSIQAFDDPMLLINMSVWESVDALQDYVYRSAHTVPMKPRKEWFDAAGDQHIALWWVPSGQKPAEAGARQRLEHLREHGASAESFTFRKRFPAPK